MTNQKNMNPKIHHSIKINRRGFLKTSSGAVLLIGSAGILPYVISCKNPEVHVDKLEKHTLSAWIQIAENGQITIYNPAAEMGQGSMTSLPVIFAEEMDADWNKVRVEFSPQEAEIYGSEGWGDRKIMLSAGSRVTKGYYSLLRRAGAQARHILINSVSREWGVPNDELSTKNGIVFHQKSKRSINYGDIVPFLHVPDDLPSISEAHLKDPKVFQLIGKDIPRTDIPSKVNGSAEFSIDVRLPDMLYGVLERGKIHGSKPTLKNEDSIKTIEGIKKIVHFDYAIGIIADRLENALAAKDKLDIEWSSAKSTGLNSQELYSKYEEELGKKSDSAPIVNIGDFNGANRIAYKSYRSDYKNDYIYHAQMEPLNAVVKVATDGQSAEAWIGSQQGFTPKMGIPRALDLDPKNVKINLKYLGGGFGRRSMTDFAEECAKLAKEMPGYPVKLIWTREDDLTYGAYRPLSLQRLSACVNASGELTGFSHIVVGDGDRLLASGIRNEHYNIPNQLAEIRIVPSGIRLKHWRAVGHGPNKFAIESMIDEIASDQGINPVDFRRKLMSVSPRALATLEKAAEMSDWYKPSAQGRAKGVAFLERSGTLSTGVCELSVDRNSGKIKVHRFWSANDAGIIVQPDNVKAQLEGGIVMGISSVLKERLTIVNGEIQQSNFHDYQLLRMEEIPESIETAIISSSGPPQGVGESGTPLVACAVANAFFALTGKRLTHLPFTPDRVLEVLNA